MSKGSPRRTLRVPESLCERIEQAIDSANQRRAGIPYDWSAWALKAIREKIAHLERGKTSRLRRRAGRHTSAEIPVMATSSADSPTPGLLSGI